MKLIIIKTCSVLIVATLMLSSTQCFANNENGRFAEEQLSPNAPKEDHADIHFENVCHDLKEEINRVRSCNSESECGQVITGTSCGCSHDLVARINADISKFQQLKKEYEALASVSNELPSECSNINFGSFCDCPRTYGFACENNVCTWNYYKVEPWGVVKPHTP